MQYNPIFLNSQEILNSQEKEHLTNLSNKIDFQKTFLDVKSNIDELGIDFIYSSAMLEGNGYSIYDTAALLKLGQTAGGKKFSDAVMILNLRESYEYLLANLNNKKLNQTNFDDYEFKDFLKQNHFLISQKLVPQGKGGIIRDQEVKISGTSYTPLPSSRMLDNELNFLIKEGQKFKNPFEKAIYYHNNISYLQYFIDCNKRTARNISTFILMQNNIFPCLYSKSNASDYISSLINYYETGNHSLFKEYFISTFETSINDNVLKPTENEIILIEQAINKRNQQHNKPKF